MTDDPILQLNQVGKDKIEEICHWADVTRDYIKKEASLEFILSSLAELDNNINKLLFEIGFYAKKPEDVLPYEKQLKKINSK